MQVMWKRLGDHTVRLVCLDEKSVSLLGRMFGDRPPPEDSDTGEYYQITVRQGGEPNVAWIDTVVSRDEEGAWRFDRPDYRLAISSGYRNADMIFYDYIGLRSAMLNWYGSVIARRNWGLIVHSSCVIHEGEAYLFAGLSGSGKTTVASLSQPRRLLSDEATIVQLSPGQPAKAYDSPMRSSLFAPSPVPYAPLRAVYLLEQSSEIRKTRLSGAEALLSLFDKIWYWSHEPGESVQVVRLCRMLAEQVPVYRLQFQKNDRFWEAIS